MMKKTMTKGIILLFLLSSLIPITSSYETNKVYSIHVDENGTLSGYVKDTSMNPIGGAKVRVYFHETYEENYTDSSGYYHVTNIPICYCLKNATASKEGYTTEWVLLAIGENTTYAFVLTPLGTIYVDDDNADGPWNGTTEHPYQHIQDGIDNSQVYNTIFVKKGIYYENIFINKTITLQGEENHYTIIDGHGNRDVIYVGYPANGVTISGFTIRNAGKRHGNGMFDGGIDLHSDENTIKNNIFTKNYIAGLILFGSSKNSIENNYIGDSNRSGIEFLSGRFNQISNNTITNNPDYGISVSSMGNSSKNIFSCNNFENNRQGISVCHSDNTIIHNNFLNNYVLHASCPFNIWTF